MIKIIKFLICILAFYHSIEVNARKGGSAPKSRSSMPSIKPKLSPMPHISRTKTYVPMSSKKTTIQRTPSISHTTTTTVPVVRKTTVYKYSSYKTPRTYSNIYYNPVTIRTYHPLVAYYHPIIFNPLGYYSIVYHNIYYDGYGYNFYYGGYGYYQYSVHPSLVVHTSSNGLIWAIIVVVLVACCCCWCCVVKHKRGNYIEFESEEAGSMHSNYAVEEVVIT